MLAGCSSTLLSARPKLRIDASVQLQSACYHFQPPEKHSPSPLQQMSARRLDLPCGFSSSRNVSVEKPPPPPPSTTSCSFRQNPAMQSSSSSSMVAQSPTWGGAIEIAETAAAAAAAGRGPHWRQSSRLKRRPHERSSRNDGNDRAKRTRTGDIAGSCEVEGDEWLPRSIEEAKVFLVPSAASFPHQKPSFQPESSTGEEDDVYSSSWSTAYTSSPDRTKNPFAPAIGDELVSLLMSCADSMSSGNYEATSFFLSRLGETAHPMGAPIHRLAAYFAEALALRSAKLHPHIFAIAPPRSITDPCEEDSAAALRLLNCVTPIPKFLHFTMNESLLKAFEGSDKVHIIDFDIKQGLQWPSLLQSLTARPNPPSHVRITGVGESRPELQETGAQLMRLAESLGLPLEFHAVVDRLQDVRLWMLHVKSSECVAVNCVLTMHRTLGDETGKAFMDFLALIRSTNPAIVTMVEQEAEHNQPNWGTRLSRSLNYYAAIFDSMDHALPRDSKARLKVEEAFAKEIRNMVACEGKERIERHESFENWKKMMQEGGFESKSIGEREMLQGRMILRMYSGENYSIQKHEGGGVTLKWMDQPLFTVSAWSPLPKPQPNLVASSSSS